MNLEMSNLLRLKNLNPPNREQVLILPTEMWLPYILSSMELGTLPMIPPNSTKKTKGAASAQEYIC